MTRKLLLPTLLHLRIPPLSARRQWACQKMFEPSAMGSGSSFFKQRPSRRPSSLVPLAGIHPCLERTMESETTRRAGSECARASPG